MSRDYDGTAYCMLAAVVSVCLVLSGSNEFRAARRLPRYMHYRTRLLIHSPVYDDGCGLRPSRV
jgi:hypothetical protein